MLELLIDKKENVKTIMLVENGILLEKHEEHENQKRLEGNIYIGKVKDILPGMQSAFIDIGEGKNTLIKIKDVLPKIDEASDEYLEDKNIKDLLKVGQELLVQIKKDGTLTKGAKVTTHINLPGRFVVFLPNANFITVSQKIEAKEERERLIGIVKEILPKGTGAIIRTAGENKTKEVLENDLRKVINEWNNIEKKLENREQETRLLYDNVALVRRTIIDIIDRDLEKIIINDKETFEFTKNILKEININIELKESDLFEMYDLNKQIDNLSKRKIWLRCGGFITIDKTEALTAIDVNTGKYTGKDELEKTIYKVNKEATIEIARQLRLRDIGGIIIIDYIDMHIDENKKKIEEFLKEQLKKDRTKCQVEGFTKLNLLEMTRKNMCNNDWNNDATAE